MTRCVVCAIVCLAGVVTSFRATAQEQNLSVGMRGSLTTSSRIFTNPNAPDQFQRNEYFGIEDFYGYGVEVRYRLPESNIAFSLSADFIKKTTDRPPVQISTSRSIPMKDGYRVVPVELTGYFIIPVSTRAFGVYMGGGVGMYFGSRLFSIGDSEAPTVESGHGAGIHVLGGVSYQFTPWLSLNGEMKFRDLQFSTVNQFPTSTIQYNGTTITVGRYDAQVHTEGVIFQLATMFHF
jgi:opacity protein-like surface antigen